MSDDSVGGGVSPMKLVLFGAVGMVLAFAGWFLFSPAEESAPAEEARPATPDKGAETTANEPKNVEPLPGTISGHMRLEDGSEPPEFARVSIHSLEGRELELDTGSYFDHVQAPDNMGAFSFSVPPGSYRVLASAPGYLSSSAIVEVTAETTSEVELALAAGGQLVEGTVFDLTGGTVPFALVHARAMGGGMEEPSEEKGLTMSGEDGSYRLQLPVGNYQLVAQHQDYTSGYASIEVVTGVNRQDLRLVPGAALEGVVRVRGEEQPAAGATVSFRSAEHSGSVRTDAEGKFRITALPSGVISLWASRVSSFPAEGEISEDQDFSLGIAETLDGIVLVMDGGHSLSGRVIDANSKEGIAGAIVSASSENGLLGSPVTTDAEGNFRMTALPAGSLAVHAQKGGYLRQGFMQRVKVPDAKELELALRTGYMVRGSVEPNMRAHLRVAIAGEDIAGEGIAGENRGARTQMALGSVQSLLNESDSDEEGAFVMGPFSPGTYKVEARAGGLLGSETITIGNQDLEGVSIAMESGGVLRGQVVNQKGKPVAGAWVGAQKAQGNRRVMVISNGRNMLGHRDRSDENGNFEIRGLENGDYELRVQDRNQLPLSWADDSRGPKLVTLQDQAEARLEVRYSDESISGIVVDTSGQPVPDAWVRLQPSTGSLRDRLREMGGPRMARGGEDGARAAGEEVIEAGRRAREEEEHSGGEGSESRVEMRMVVVEEDSGSGGSPLQASLLPPVLSDENGRFVIEGLSPGNYNLFAQSARGSARGFVAEVPAGETQAKVELQSVRDIRGIVKDASGQPVSDFRVRIDGRRPQSRSYSGQADGSFVLSRVDPGDYEIVATSASGEGRAKVVVEVGKDAEVSIQLARLHLLTGRLVDEAGQGLSGVLVVAAPMTKPGELSLDVDNDTPATDSGGRFRLALREGKYVLMALDPTQGPVHRQMIEVSNASKETDLGTLVASPPSDMMPGNPE